MPHDMSTMVARRSLPRHLRNSMRQTRGSPRQCPVDVTGGSHTGGTWPEYARRVTTGVVMRVLIVDDDDGDALIIGDVLRGSTRPVLVDRVADGQEALDFLRRVGGYRDAIRPDVILLDLNMPRVDGRQTLAEVKSDPELLSIPVVVLTTSGEPADIVDSYREHANAYVTKPLILDELEAAVRQVSRFYGEIAVLPPEPPPT